MAVTPHAATSEGMRSARTGIIVNSLLALAKLVAGLVGNSYALVADAVESTADIFSSFVVWTGLRVAAREPDETYPFGYGRAETLAGAVVAVMLLLAAIGIAIEAVIEIRTPHHAPAPWTLAVLVAVIAIKYVLSRRVTAVGEQIGSGAVKADAWHHLSDALTSGFAFVGISVALWGGPGWEMADDWAALAASGIIMFSGVRLLRAAGADLMDRAAPPETVRAIRASAEGVEGVLATEKLLARRSGLFLRVTIHVQADPALSLHHAHVLGGKVKRAIMRDTPNVQSVLVHMEPFEPE